jgi:hypothetical protein
MDFRDCTLPAIRRIVRAIPRCALFWVHWGLREASLSSWEGTSMKVGLTLGHRTLLATDRFFGHVAVVLGVLLMFAGTSLTMTEVRWPVGLPVGVVGFVLYLWGVFQPLGARKHHPPTGTPHADGGGGQELGQI